MQRWNTTISAEDVGAGYTYRTSSAAGAVDGQGAKRVRDESPREPITATARVTDAPTLRPGASGGDRHEQHGCSSHHLMVEGDDRRRHGRAADRVKDSTTEVQSRATDLRAGSGRRATVD